MFTIKVPRKKKNVYIEAIEIKCDACEQQSHKQVFPFVSDVRFRGVQVRSMVDRLQHSR